MERSDAPRLPSGTVTFLFTDIEGSTRLLRELRGRYGEVVAEHRRLLRSLVEAAGGHEVDTQGDSFFFAFRRARDAAVAAAAAQRGLAEQAWPEDVQLRVRMGIHTGEPSVGGEGYVGLGVHRAARIMALGHGGQVLISQATRAVLEDEDLDGIAIRDLGEHRLKDFDRPQRIYQLEIEGLPSVLETPQTAPAGPTDAESPRGNFVGRGRELATLTTGLDDALGGHGRLLLLAGEPGIGKTRLADELASHATARGARVVVGRCWEAGGAPAYWPWVQSLRSYVRDAEAGALRVQLGPGAGDVAQLLPELRDAFPDLPVPVALESEGARFRLFESVSAFLRRAAESRPLVLVLDDLHAADEPSLLLLRFLARELGASRLLLLGAYRDVDPNLSAALTSALTELAREPVTTILPLRGLGEPDVAHFIEITAARAPAADLAATVHAETEGNPLFVGEIVRLLAAEGRLEESTAPRLAIPQSVRDVIGRRLRHLSEECSRLLALASVLGREFDLEALARVSGINRGALLELLDEAVEVRVVSELPGAMGRMRFAHALIRDAAYQGLSRARRVQLHREVGEALEELYSANPEPHLAELAHQFLEAAPAGDERKAVEYARRAASRAIEMLAYEEAVRLYETALGLSTAPDTMRCELLLGLGDAQTRAGATPDAKRAYREGAELADSLGLREQLARSALGYGGRLLWEVSRDDPYLLPLLERALVALGDQDSPLRVRLLARLGGGPLRDSTFPPERRAAVTREAVAAARRIGDPATLAYALDGYIAAHHSPDHTASQEALATELIVLAMQVGDLERAMEGHEHRSQALMELGDVSGARGDLEAMSRLAAELRQPSQDWFAAETAALHALLEGRLADAEHLIDEALALGGRAQAWSAAVSYRLQLFVLRRLQGRLEEVKDVLRRATREYPTYPIFRCVFALVEAELGRAAESRGVLEAMADRDFAALPYDEEWLVSMSFLAETAGTLGDAGLAARLYDRLVPYADRVGVATPEISIGSLSRPVGILAATMSRWDHAVRHFEDAIAMNERIDARPWLALAREGYASALLGRGAPGDEREAQEARAEAVASYRQLGMARHAERLRAEGALP